MSLQSIEPRDPLIVRDGRPNDGRSEPRSMGFPLPSVVAGVARRALGVRDGVFDVSLVPDLLRLVAVRGPLLRGESDLLVPAPLDALVTMQPEDSLRLQALAPIPLPKGAATSLGGALVGLAAGQVGKGKPYGEGPRFWRWSSMEHWLREPTERSDQGTRALLDGGITGLVREERVHVAIGRSFTAEEGMLFGTDGLRACAQRWDRRALAERHAEVGRGHRTRLDVSVTLETDLTFPDSTFPGRLDGLRPMGGERRLIHWHTSTTSSWPTVPDWLVDHVVEVERPVVRLVLLTPAFVSSSHQPACLAQPGVEVIAARVDRPETMSGWDLAKRAPKRTRRLASAGSVYWLRLSGNREERRQFVERTWMANVGDDEQLRRDGFGLAVLGLGRDA